MLTWRGHNRRVGLRVPAFGVQLSWAPVVSRKRFRDHDQVGSATVLDLSLSGALVRAPYDRRITVGTQVFVAAADGTALADVRRITSDVDLHGAFYGIHFIRVDPPLFDFINDTLATSRSTNGSV